MPYDHDDDDDDDDDYEWIVFVHNKPWLTKFFI